MRIAMLCLSVLLLGAAAVWAQPGPPGKLGPGEPSYTQGPYVLQERAIASPWRDTVHKVGMAGVGLAFLVALAGLAIYFGFGLTGKPFDYPLRRTLRGLHMAGGATAIALGTAHYIGRCLQAGEAFFGWTPPTFAQLGFLIVLASGILRYWTPRVWRKQWRAFAYVHRLAVLGALYYTTRHALHEGSHFAGR